MAVGVEAQNGLQVAVGRDAEVQDCAKVVEGVRVGLALGEAHHGVEEVQGQNEDLLGLERSISEGNKDY